MKKNNIDTQMITNLQNSLIRLARWEHLADKAQEAWEADLLNEDREEAADKYYALQWHEWLHALNALMRLTGMDETTAKDMLYWKNRYKIDKIVQRLKCA